jgi:hypothetical protein
MGFIIAEMSLKSSIVARHIKEEALVETSASE